MRGASVLRNAAASAGKPKPMSADSTLYHVAPTGFWKKFRDAVVINPEISSGLPIPTLHRYPQPGSRTELYATPATAASDPAFNPYYKRDTRRAYPQTSTITQSHLTSLLLASPTLAALPSPSTANVTPSNSSAISPPSDSDAASVTVTTSAVPALSSILEKMSPGQALAGSGVSTGTTSGGLPPAPPGKKWVPQTGDEIPHGEHAYFPMIGYK
ncbi:uncharacterized protein MKK02DRAFT_43878 [Dioszegia hungarica]|uniref:Uncharacterized protein n=1 Tax=Dioszegia hungarica TaxID=4972 RepID=A0AA38H6S4_9TREE|nr:uncharacterized protein MKK02DRAFT_43878 [Dioszegia hungarica]KAI9635198.1 hypothetical protein MKK02DRAFT_43878 [Dioszegia hungarica]